MIPKIVHFVFGLSPDFGCRPFSLIHYTAIKAARDRIRPDRICIYYQYEPSGYWWNSALSLGVQTLKVKAPTSVFGNPIRHYAHAADVLRMGILLEQGGIYLDSDFIAVRDFDDLLHHEFVMGIETGVGLCNAVMIAKPNATFLREWFERYVNFNTDDWNGHSVCLPARMMSEGVGPITALPQAAFFNPMYDDPSLESLFVQEVGDFSGAYGHHLWESISWNKHRLGELTIGAVKSGNGLFHRVAKSLL